MQSPYLPDLDFFGSQIIGDRKEQQDFFLLEFVSPPANSETGLLLLVADGMGGYEGGREAAQRAVEGFLNGFNNPRALEFRPSPPQPHLVELLGLDKKSQTQLLLTTTTPPNPATKKDAQALARGLQGANDAVAALIRTNSEKYSQCGTTILAALVTSKHLLWTSVGDSPLFLWRNERLSRLNADHSMLPVLIAMAKAGEITPSELETHPQRNMLLSAVIGDVIDLVDSPSCPVLLRKGDILIAATDGILSLRKTAISSLLQKYQFRTAREIVRSLLDAVEASHFPHQDNTTIALVKFRESPC
ncbi:MAG: protein phosphatase 2C domain-containing protein [Chthoniobacterales bacterium]|nr:protein phosphatase 2C domain-containing protein [Chthoniobacterales bacterium]